MNVADMINPEPNGYEPLRRTIAAYLGISRGIACTRDHVFITAGYRSALGLICRALLQPGDTGWFEDPGYPLARRFLEHVDMRLAPVAVDDEGLNVEVGRQQVRNARFAVVTPTHQSPLGVTLSSPPGGWPCWSGPMLAGHGSSRATTTASSAIWAVLRSW